MNMRQIQPETRDKQFNIRLYDSQKTLIEKAADIQHKSRTDFVLEVACREAENVLLDQRLFMLSEAQFDAFEAAISKPLADPAKLRHLLDKKAPWDRDR